MSKELAPCGTPSAYNRHLRRGEEPDAACRAAATAAQRERRRRDDRELRHVNARRRALAALAKRHPAEYHALLTAELLRLDEDGAA